MLKGKIEYYVEVDCNGGEYVNHTVITCKKLKKIDEKTVMADNVKIQFDEQILDITDNGGGNGTKK